jgi:hypothetical protein
VTTTLDGNSIGGIAQTVVMMADYGIETPETPGILSDLLPAKMDIKVNASGNCPSTRSGAPSPRAAAIDYQTVNFGIAGDAKATLERMCQMVYNGFLRVWHPNTSAGLPIQLLFVQRLVIIHSNPVAFSYSAYRLT